MNCTATAKRTLEGGDQYISVVMNNIATGTVQAVKALFDYFALVKKSTDTAYLFDLEDLAVTPSNEERTVTLPFPAVISADVSDTSASTFKHYIFTVSITGLVSNTAVLNMVNTAFRALQDPGGTVIDITDKSVTVTNIQLSIK